MTKKEAIKLMESGVKVTHRYFEEEEWITIRNSRILFENNISVDFDKFWSIRTQKQYDTGWEIFEN